MVNIFLFVPLPYTSGYVEFQGVIFLQFKLFVSVEHGEKWIDRNHSEVCEIIIYPPSIIESCYGFPLGEVLLYFSFMTKVNCDKQVLVDY